MGLEPHAGHLEIMAKDRFPTPPREIPATRRLCRITLPSSTGDALQGKSQAATWQA